jgi:FixJ family two-component response regulator
VTDAVDQKIVWILDDDPGMREALARVLNLYGFYPRSFASIRDFYARAKPEQAVCLILDIDLHGQSGIDLKRQLSGSAPGLPVIFTTGGDCEATRLAVEQVGCAAYLPKPFGSKALLNAIETAIGMRN